MICLTPPIRLRRTFDDENEEMFSYHIIKKILFISSCAVIYKTKYKLVRYALRLSFAYYHIYFVF